MLSEPEIDHGQDVAIVARALLREAGIDGPISLAPLTHGGNNRVVRVNCGTHAYVLKRYFRHTLDPRDRFGADTSFSAFLWSAGVRDIPQLIAAEEELGAALFAHVPGNSISGSLAASDVAQALDFLAAINRNRQGEEAGSLPIASEACFAICDHLELVERRVSALELSGNSAGVFARDELRPAWGEIRSRVASQVGPEFDRTLRQLERCLSPSDFGFHNAIARPSGKLVFHDFEYAGWDDPAKLVCDFFCQTQVPVPLAYLPRMVERLARCLGVVDWLEQRVRWLLPVYRIKWCCILLGSATPSGSARRRFAGRLTPDGAELTRQVGCARELLALARQ
jgi:hypothetical protein